MSEKQRIHTTAVVEGNLDLLQAEVRLTSIYGQAVLAFKLVGAGLGDSLAASTPYHTLHTTPSVRFLGQWARPGVVIEMLVMLLFRKLKNLRE